MCDICLRSPCHPRCPNAPEPPVECECSNCGAELHVGDEAYNINGKEWCKECIKDCLHTLGED